ncbi:DNA repair protein RadC (modular protein) [Pseudomonas sp. 9Ag]|nr:DNA repair protein RadC (modular protein) [Pseudomonas sp. 9Ag]
MRLHKLKASEPSGTYLVESPVTEADILLMARQLANLRLRRGRALTSPKDVFSHLQALLADYEHEVFALLLLDSRHRVIAFQELFRGTLDGANVYPREIVKAALEHNAAAMVLVHNHPSGNPEPSQADRTLTHRVKEALDLVGGRTLDHIVVGREGCYRWWNRATCKESADEATTDLRCRFSVCRNSRWLLGSSGASGSNGPVSAAAGRRAAGLLDLQSAAGV